jgi:hypothetical protein
LAEGYSRGDMACLPRLQTNIDCFNVIYFYHLFAQILLNQDFMLAQMLAMLSMLAATPGPEEIGPFTFCTW